MDNYWWPYGTVSTPTEPDASDDIGVTRDDLVRLVVGMQWREWFALFVIEGRTTSFRCPTNMADLRPASDIIDEWLGVAP